MVLLTVQWELERLLQQSLQQKPGQVEVWIVDPNAESIASRLKPFGLDRAKGVRVDLRTFEDLMGVFWKSAPDMVRAAASNNAQFDKWVKMLSQMRGFWPPPSTGTGALTCEGQEGRS